MNNIYLVGFMGTGKSAVGKELARRKKSGFIDLDELIELKEKRTISDIFAKDKEPYFRKLEKQALREAAGENNFVVACGGGIVIDPDNIRLMKDSGKIICLTASPEAILRRTSGTSKRPLLDVEDPKKQIQALMEKRAACYAQADETIDTSGLSVGKTAEKIMEKIGGRN